MFCKFLNGVHSLIHNKFEKNDKVFSVFIAGVFALTKIKNGSSLIAKTGKSDVKQKITRDYKAIGSV